MLLASFFPLVVLILAVLGSIVFGLTTPTEAAAMGAFGGFVLAAVYMLINYPSAQMRKILLVWVPLWVPFWHRSCGSGSQSPAPRARFRPVRAGRDRRHRRAGRSSRCASRS